MGDPERHDLHAEGPAETDAEVVERGVRAREDPAPRIRGEQDPHGTRQSEMKSVNN